MNSILGKPPISKKFLQDKSKNMKEQRIAVIGLGYVGLPLAVEFGKKFPTLGFDINTKRVNELQRGVDNTLEVENHYLKSVIVDNPKTIDAKGLYCTASIEDISDCNVFIVTVPTPTDKYNRPVLTPLVKSSETLAAVLKKGDIVIYESTVYPGVTEDECVPVLEANSGLKYNEDFFVGYSPERINPGDKEHTVTKILKVTSGSTPEIADVVDAIYREVIVAGTHKAPSIKVAEAAKVIENSQRDINIAFVNELSKIFNRLGIDTLEVLEAAGTKWNFLPFRPGLVGGHCIGVDPYYLKHAAQVVGVHPELIGAARRINDSLHEFAARKLIKQLIKSGHPVSGARILLLGYTFKENCPDIRNTRVSNLIDELLDYGCTVEICDPWVRGALSEPYSDMLRSTDDLLKERYNAIVLAVPHREFLDLGIAELHSYGVENSVFFDFKGCFNEARSGYISL